MPVAPYSPSQQSSSSSGAPLRRRASSILSLSQLSEKVGVTKLVQRSGVWGEESILGPEERYGGDDNKIPVRSAPPHHEQESVFLCNLADFERLRAECPETCAEVIGLIDALDIQQMQSEFLIARGQHLQEAYVKITALVNTINVNQQIIDDAAAKWDNLVETLERQTFEMYRGIESLLTTVPSLYVNYMKAPGSTSRGFPNWLKAKLMMSISELHQAYAYGSNGVRSLRNQWRNDDSPLRRALQVLPAGEEAWLDVPFQYQSRWSPYTGTINSQKLRLPNMPRLPSTKE